MGEERLDVKDKKWKKENNKCRNEEASEARQKQTNKQMKEKDTEKKEKEG